MKRRKKPAPVDPAMKAYGIAQFCKLHGMSRQTFYKLLRLGEGPRLMRVGRRRLVSIEAAEAWRRAREKQEEAPH